MRRMFLGIVPAGVLARVAACAGALVRRSKSARHPDGGSIR
ncbi:MAG TPA: hypothetical protein VFL12_10740 [Thermoanaerobaculia bacterium]|nr:hypothetical protein [Thermoanaerobaculia bacterium]